MVDQSDLNAAAERFIDYWTGKGTWAATPENRRQAIAASVRAIARLLTAVLPRVRGEEIDGVGHMAPVTHPERVNPLIERFLEAAQSGAAADALRAAP